MGDPRASRDGVGKDGASPVPRVRLAAILAHLLERGRATRAELERVACTNTRNVRDDLRKLARADLVRAVGAGRDRAYTVHPALLRAGLPGGDRLALVVGLQVTRFLDGTPLHRAHPGLEDLAARVRYLPEPSRRYAPRADIVRAVLDGVLEGRRLHLRYDGPGGGSAPADFFATNMLVYRRALYLVGRYSLTSTKVYALAVDRVLQATAAEPFAAQPFDVDAWLAGRFGLTSDKAHPEPEDLALRFAADVALLVRERDFHPTATLEELRDGQVRLRMCASGRELLPFVLQWGSKVVVESPSWLRDEVRDELAAALRRYHQDPGP